MWASWELCVELEHRALVRMWRGGCLRMGRAQILCNQVYQVRMQAFILKPIDDG